MTHCCLSATAPERLLFNMTQVTQTEAEKPIAGASTFSLGKYKSALSKDFENLRTFRLVGDF